MIVFTSLSGAGGKATKALKSLIVSDNFIEIKRNVFKK